MSNSYKNPSAAIAAMEICHSFSGPMMTTMIRMALKSQLIVCANTAHEFIRNNKKSIPETVAHLKSMFSVPFEQFFHFGELVAVMERYTMDLDIDNDPDLSKNKASMHIQKLFGFDQEMAPNPAIYRTIYDTLDRLETIVMQTEPQTA